MSQPQYGITNFSSNAVHVTGGGKDETYTMENFGCDDYAEIDFTATQDYYVVGLMAYISNPNIANLFDGWGPFRHEQAAWPAFLAIVMAVLGLDISDYPELPSFEAKFMRIHADEDCWLRFGGPDNVQHFIPKDTYVTFRRRTNIIFIERDSADGTACVDFFG